MLTDWPTTSRDSRTLVIMVLLLFEWLLQGDKYGNESRPFLLSAQRFPDHRTGRLCGIATSHGMPRGRGSSQQIAYFNRAILCIDFAVHFAQERDGLPIVGGLLLIQHDTRLVIASPGNDAHHAFVARMLAGIQRTVIAQHHNRARVHQALRPDVEIFS